MAVKPYINGVFRSGDSPRSAIAAPFVRFLDLLVVVEDLLEEPELVVDSVTHRGEIKSCQRVEETGGETTETPVTKAHVGCPVGDPVDVLPVGGEGRPGGVEDLQVAKIVLE